MDQVNVNAAPRQPMRPPRRPSIWWPIAGFVAIVAVLLIVLGVKHATSPSATSTATATPTVLSSTATPVQQVVPTATAGAASSPTDTPIPAASATPAAPANPTALQVRSGTCVDQAITWSWPRADRATAYELVLYDPRTGATIKNVVTSATQYRLAAGPGAAVALKIRSRNAAGTGQGYFTPGSVGRVPSIATNPTLITVAAQDHKLTWSWAGSRHATAYDFVLFHYDGSAAHTDISGRTSQGHWSTAVTPGITYYLKVRSVGQCGPSDYFSTPRGAIVGATPTPASQ